MNSQRWLIVLGVVLICVAVALPVRGEMENARAQKASESILAQLSEAEAPTLADGSMPTVHVGSYDYVGSLAIPSLGIELPVAATVDEACLRDCPCVYSGSCYTNDLIICGEGYSSHFGNLGSVDVYDDVLFTAADGVVHRYVVSNVETDEAEDIDSYVDDWDLTLFTLKADGTYCVVRCVRT